MTKLTERFRQVLVLDAAYAPLSVVSWQRAVTLLVGEKARLLESQGLLAGQTWRLAIPSVLVLLRYFRKGAPRPLPFSRRNVYLRDRFTCQYCGRRFTSSKGLTLDHVIPRVRGGTNTWENVVACCSPCNAKKGSGSLRDAGIKLSRPPRRPSWLPRGLPHFSRDVPPEWRTYLPVVADEERVA
jgi:5-methylcytosine-specific restriction endonuclease McrA